MQPETRTKREFVKALRAIPGTTWTIVSQQSIRGEPDVVGCVVGFYFAFEVKEEFEDAYHKRERLQRYKLSKVMLAGGSAAIVTKESWPWWVERVRKFVDERRSESRNT